MAHRSSNRRRNTWVVSLLDVQPTDRVLEIGFGPGIAIGELARRTTEGVVIGVDQSEVMVRLARRRNAAAVHGGRVDLRLGSVEALPDLGGAMDKILSVNSMGFWPDPVARLSELRCRLRTGGVIAIASQPRCPGATRETSARAAREIDSALRVRRLLEDARRETRARPTGGLRHRREQGADSGFMRGGTGPERRSVLEARATPGYPRARPAPRDRRLPPRHADRSSGRPGCSRSHPTNR